MIEKLLLEVLDDPTKKRIVIETDLPVFDDTFNDVDNNLYYMIDRSTPDGGNTAFDKWHISTNVGSVRTLGTHKEVLALVDRLIKATNEADIHIESL